MPDISRRLYASLSNASFGFAMRCIFILDELARASGHMMKAMSLELLMFMELVIYRLIWLLRPEHSIQNRACECCRLQSFWIDGVESPSSGSHAPHVWRRHKNEDVIFC